jgi:excisionase family DNA binding protein
MAVDELAIEVSGTRPGDTRPSDAPGWRNESECRKHPTRWWFGGGHRETLQAKGICADCPVQGPCLEFALSRTDLLGIWAGTTSNERTSMRRARRPCVVDAAAAVDAGLDADGPHVEIAPVELAEIADVDIDLVAEAEADRDAEIEFEANLRQEGDAVRRQARRPGRGVGPESMFVERDDLLTPAEAAHRLGVTPNTVTRWSRAGKIAAIQTMGGHRRFRRSEIERVLQAANLDTATPI